MALDLDQPLPLDRVPRPPTSVALDPSRPETSCALSASFACVLLSPQDVCVRRADPSIRPPFSPVAQTPPLSFFGKPLSPLSPLSRDDCPQARHSHPTHSLFFSLDMYSLPLSSRSRTLSSIDHASPPDAAAFDPLRASSSQLSQRPAQRPLRQLSSGQVPATPRQTRPATFHAVEDEHDPFHSFVSTVLLSKAAATNNMPPEDDFASPASSTTSYASPDTFGRFDSPTFRSYDDTTVFSTPASSTCPSRSNSDEALACSATADPLDTTALHHSLAQLDLAQASHEPSTGLSSYFTKPASSTVASVARPNRPVFPPPRSASEPVFNKQEPPANLVLAAERNRASSSGRRVFDAILSPAASSFGSGSERGPLSPTTPTSPAFLEEPARAASALSTSPNRRRLALPKVDSSNLAAPSAPVRECSSALARRSARQAAHFLYANQVLTTGSLTCHAAF